MENHITLKELNFYIKEALQLSFPESLWLIAEIGELKVNYAGHCYIDLIEKDQNSNEIIARAKATIWSWQFRFIKPYFETTTGQTLGAGIKVLISASVEFHEVYGLSLNIKDIDPTYTLGDMARKRQEIIARLIDEGVMDMNKEIELPDIPSRIAIISSGTAAGYLDFMQHLNENDKGYRFYTKLFQSVMQGNDAEQSIIAALDHIFENEEAFDVVVIIRGGGAQMDLSCFDSYDLAFHIAQFPLPVLTGIGHEKDETVADMVAHTKLKTPTAVANFLIDKFDLIAETIDELETATHHTFINFIDNEKHRLSQAVKLLKPLLKSKLERTSAELDNTQKSISPTIHTRINHENNKLIKRSTAIKAETNANLKNNLNQLSQKLSDLKFIIKLKTERETLNLLEKQHLAKWRSNQQITSHYQKVEWFEKNIRLIDPKNILKRGYSITLMNGKAIKDAQQVKAGDELTSIFYKGKITTTVNNNLK
ncbi:MAG: exodeoxyribonuclease VII large subunit [Prolixibacteraceae bacterium]|nr:exodeoxyribonuclease VII large subunit [Prolixibacteraceae bacterium]